MAEIDNEGKVWGLLRAAAKAYDKSPMAIAPWGERAHDARLKWLLTHYPVPSEAPAGSPERLLDDIIPGRRDPHPLPTEVLRRIRVFRLADVVNRLRNRQIRARGGWVASDCWSLGHVFTQRLGEQLVFSAENYWTWPGEGRYESADAWKRDLHFAGDRLLRYNGIYCLAGWGTDEYDPDRYDEIYADAQNALRWIADNLGDLWD